MQNSFVKNASHDKSLAWGGLKLEKCICLGEVGGSVIFVFGVGGMYCLGGVILLGMGGGGSRNWKENLKLHNPSIESIFRITSLI